MLELMFLFSFQVYHWSWVVVGTFSEYGIVKPIFRADWGISVIGFILGFIGCIQSDKDALFKGRNSQHFELSWDVCWIVDALLNSQVVGSTEGWLGFS